MNETFALVPFDADCQDLAAGWQHQAAQAPAFLSWDWQRLMRRDVDVAARTLVLLAGSRPLAMLTRRTAWRHGWVRACRWYLNETGDPAIDGVAVEYNGLLQGACVPAALRWLLLNLPQVDELVVRNADASTASALIKAAADVRWRARTTKETSAPFIDFDALRSGGGCFEQTLGKNTRASIRRTRRLYENKFGPLALSVAASDREARLYWEELAHLHLSQWQARGSAGAFSNSGFRPFHHAYLELAYTSGSVDLLRITAGEEVVGYLYNLVSPGKRIMAYQSGFAPSPDNRWKPGYLCHAMAVQHYAEQGTARYDFLAGPAQYKRQLASKLTPMRSIVAFAPRVAIMIEDALRQVRERAFGRRTTL